jgi:hypothetical protein
MMSRLSEEERREEKMKKREEYLSADYADYADF